MAGSPADQSANVAPPSTTTADPLTKAAGCEHRKATILPKSAGAPITPDPPSSFMRSVAWGPGHATFRVMPLWSDARSWAAVFAQAHRPTRAVLDKASEGTGCTTE